MANWMTHTRIADRLLERFPMLDARGFAVGSVAPDCNVENESWTAFEPPREVTHWMSGETKLSADYEAFYDRYIRDRESIPAEEYAFLMGYFAHLVTDVEYTKWICDEARVHAAFERLRQHPLMAERLVNAPETLQALKGIFGKPRVFEDVFRMENEYVAQHPHASYESILRRVNAFPEYVNELPPGGIARKIAIVAGPARQDMPKTEGLFFSRAEYAAFLSHTVGFIQSLWNQR